MTFDGARAFFAILKWLGWIVCALAVFAFISSSGPQRGMSGQFLAISLLASGFGTAAFAMIGEMIASIAGDVQAMREIAQAQAKAQRG